MQKEKVVACIYNDWCQEDDDISLYHHMVC